MNLAATWISHHSHESCRSHYPLTPLNLTASTSSMNKPFLLSALPINSSCVPQLPHASSARFSRTQRGYRNQVFRHMNCRPACGVDAKSGRQIRVLFAEGVPETNWTVLRSSSRDQLSTLERSDPYFFESSLPARDLQFSRVLTKHY
jgi:hypothetical protein